MAGPKKKTATQLQQENHQLRVSRAVQFWGPIVRLALVGVIIVMSLRCISVMVIALAGKQTVANIDFLKVSDLFAWAGTALGGVGWYNERRLRKKTIEELAPRAAERQKRLDSGRSSSQLQPDGTTRPEDAP